MRVSIQSRLTVGAVGFTTIVLAASLWAARVSFVEGFTDYVEAIEQERLGRLAEHMAGLYAENGGWPADLDEAILRDFPPPGRRPPHAGGRADRGSEAGRPGAQQRGDLPQRAEADGRRRPPRPPARSRGRRPPPTAFHNAAGEFLAGDPLPDGARQISVPVEVDSIVVGSVRGTPSRGASRPLESAFVRNQRNATLVIGTVALLFAALIAFRFAQIVLFPIRQLVAGVSELTAGNYALRLDDRKDDEIGDLLKDVNALAATLEQTRDARRRMFADISHELRTPLAVLTAELEAIRDGLRPFDANSLQSLHEELERLRRLVEDLRALSTSDLSALGYHFEQHDLADVVSSMVESLRPEGLVIHTRLDSALARVDRGRIEQLLRNLLTNSVSYTDRPGRIEIELSTRETTVLRVSDSAPSVSREDCEHLFEPLFRVEASRSRAYAGSGLGLAICQRIVAAHRGTIVARPSALGGLEVEIELPGGSGE